MSWSALIDLQSVFMAIIFSQQTGGGAGGGGAGAGGFGAGSGGEYSIF